MAKGFVTPQNGFTNYSAEGGKYGQAKVDRTVDGIVTVQGLLRAPAGETIATGTVIGRLPGGLGFEPDGIHLFQQVTHSGSVRIDVRPTGEIVFMGGTLHSFVSLSGIVFDCGSVG